MRAVEWFHAVGGFDRASWFLLAFGFVWPFAMWLAIERPWARREAAPLNV